MSLGDTLRDDKSIKDQRDMFIFGETFKKTSRDIIEPPITTDRA